MVDSISTNEEGDPTAPVISQLRARVEAGRRWLRKTSSRGAFAKREREFQKWDRFNQDLIAHYVSDAEADAYAGIIDSRDVAYLSDGPVLASLVRNFAEHLQDKLDFLDSLIDRITLRENSTARALSAQAATPLSLAPDPRRVFVVHGRDLDARDALFEFLHAVGLEPLEWEQIVALTGKGAPYVGEVLDAGFDAAQAVVVLLTGDDLAHLRPELSRPNEPESETTPTAQPRQNVLFEAGMAFGRNARRTILLQAGAERQISDIDGRHFIRVTKGEEWREQLVGRLRTAECRLTGSDDGWKRTRGFRQELRPVPSFPPQRSGDSVDQAIGGLRGFSLSINGHELTLADVLMDCWEVFAVGATRADVERRLHARHPDRTEPNRTFVRVLPGNPDGMLAHLVRLGVIRGVEAVVDRQAPAISGVASGPGPQTIREAMTRFFLTDNVGRLVVQRMFADSAE